MKRGFTLIELLAVILILGIIALIAIPTVNIILKESRAAAFKTTVMTLANKAEETCQIDGIKDKAKNSLYTIVDGKFDHPLEIKGDLPNEGYILVNNNCEIAYSFYDESNVVSKNFKNNKPLVTNKKTTEAYGTEWKTTISSLDDTYTRTLDSSSIPEEDVKVQVGNTPVTNAFDKLDIYKDILPYTDIYGNEFMLIPKFYIKKTKVTKNNEIIMNYAVSKFKLDDDYYLPASFIDEGENNNKYIELPYILVGKYEAGSNGETGDAERILSKSGLTPRVNININDSRTMISKYNTEDIKGYQQYDIHVQDILSTLFTIEFNTKNVQSKMNGYVVENIQAIPTGESDSITSSSGTLSNEGKNSFHYRGIENLWGNVWEFVDGVNIDQVNGTKNSIYVSKNSRHYSSGGLGQYYNKVEAFTKFPTDGEIEEVGLDPKYPFINLATRTYDDYFDKVITDFYFQDTTSEFKIMIAGGYYYNGKYAGINTIDLYWNADSEYGGLSPRIVKSAF